MRFWVGGYTADADGPAGGIGVLRAGAVDAPLASGDLAYAGVAARADSPSWIAAHPTLDVLYAAQEAAGTVQAFVRTGDETFAPLGDAVNAGDSVCHVAVAPDGDAVIASCYGDGRVVRLPLDRRGALGAGRIAAAAHDPSADAALQARLSDLSSLAGMAGTAAIGDLPLFGAEAQAAVRRSGCSPTRSCVCGALRPARRARGASAASDVASTSDAAAAGVTPPGTRARARG